MIGGLPATAAGLAVGAAVNEKADLVRIEVRDATGTAQRILPPLPHGFPHFRVRLSIGGLGGAAAGNLPAPVAYSV